MGILIAIDGVDASGKQTQTELLKKRLENDELKIKSVSFPAYDNPSSTLVKMYLNGEFGDKPSDVNAYATSTFFADRYVSSNLIHQASKIENQEEKDKFLTWLDDLEYNVYGLPRPNVTIFLDMPPKYGIELMKDRANKSNGGDKKDIHESDISYLQKSYDNAVYVSKRFGWKHISCVENGKIRSVEDINDEIYAVIKERLS